MLFPHLTVVSKKIIVTRLICFFWFVAKVISWKVWLADRLFPVVPPFSFLFVPSAVHLILFIFSLLALFALLIFPLNRVFQVTVIVIEVLTCLLDQNRWQPWEYQYIFIILALIINNRNDKNAVSAIAFIFISVYLFSGIGKLNPVFSIFVRNKMVLSGIFHVSSSTVYEWLIYHTGYILGFIEILLGIGLCFQRSKKASAIFLIIMHLLILAILGPFGINYDRIIWPWNVVMIIILYVFFMCNTPVSISFQSIKQGWNKLIIVCFGILPVLNFFGYWDFFLSSGLFSLKPPEMYICIHNPGSSKILDLYLDRNKNKFLCDSNSALLDVRAWSFREMQVPAYPEVRIYKNIKEQLLKRYPDMNATFIVYPYFNGRKTRIELK
jgi:hypothetical protein